MVLRVLIAENYIPKRYKHRVNKKKVAAPPPPLPVTVREPGFMKMSWQLRWWIYKPSAAFVALDVVLIHILKISNHTNVALFSSNAFAKLSLTVGDPSPATPGWQS